VTTQGHFFYLLVSLVLFLVLYPYVEGRIIGAVFLSLLNSAIPISGVYAVSTNSGHFFIAMCLGVPTLVRNWQDLLAIPFLPDTTGLLFPLLFYTFTIVVLLSRILQDEEVTADTLCGAACVYLLMGLAWMTAFQLIESLHPGAFHINPAQNVDGIVNWSDLLFYSFATLTTLGYGDVTPITSPARSLATLEAVTGVLYVAFLIARLVGLYRKV
jgi:hypothetical protein